MQQLLPRPEIIIFDMDGTLVDVSQSYRETAPLAATRYLTLLGLNAPAMTGDVYDYFKRMGGFNDDWDLTAGLIELLLSSLPAVYPLDCAEPSDQESLVQALCRAAEPLEGTTPTLPDWETVIPRVRAAGGGFDGLRQVTRGRNAHLVLRTGDAGTSDLIQRIFSEVYLGERLFARFYGFPARYHQGAGLIQHERLLISLSTLETLSRRALLGIATGRTRFEAACAFESLGLGPFFGAVATIDDALEAEAALQSCGEQAVSLRKPHPFLLERAADTLDPPGEQPGSPSDAGATRLPGRRVAAYVGDTLDDILAARRADGTRRWLSIALTTSNSTADLRSHYVELGADLVLDHPDELLQVM